MREQAREEQAAREEAGGLLDEWKPPETRSAEGYTPLYALMQRLDERIQQVGRIIWSTNSKKKPPDLERGERPRSALDVLDLMAERDDMADLARQAGLAIDPETGERIKGGIEMYHEPREEDWGR